MRTYNKHYQPGVTKISTSTITKVSGPLWKRPYRCRDLKPPRPRTRQTFTSPLWQLRFVQCICRQIIFSQEKYTVSSDRTKLLSSTLSKSRLDFITSTVTLSGVFGGRIPRREGDDWRRLFIFCGEHHHDAWKRKKSHDTSFSTRGISPSRLVPYRRSIFKCGT